MLKKLVLENVSGNSTLEENKHIPTETVRACKTSNDESRLCASFEKLTLGQELKLKKRNELESEINIEQKISTCSKPQKIKMKQIPNVISKTSDKEIWIKLRICGIEKECLVDTGATISVLGKGTEDILIMAKDIQINSKMNIKTGGGEIHAGTVKKLPTSYDSENKNIQFVHCPSIEIPIALGMNFINAYQIKLMRAVPTSHFNRITEDDDAREMNENGHSAEQEGELLRELTQKENEVVENAMSLLNFSDGSTLGCQKVLQHRINTGESAPIYCLPYRYNPNVTEKIKEITDRWLNQGVIEPSRSEWRLPIVVVTKTDNSLRLCLDARKLNAITKKDCHITPNVLHKIESLPQKAKHFVRLDLNEAFLQTELHPKDRKKTAFSIPNIGEFQFARMPFGLVNSPSTQSRLMDLIFQEISSPYLVHYLDDVIIMGVDIPHLVKNIKLVAKVLNAHNLTVSRKKTSKVLKRIRILGHMVDEEGIHTDPRKTKAIDDWQVPKTGKELQRFLGFANWYRRFVKDYAIIAAPLYQLSTKKLITDAMWTEKENESFKTIKKRMCQSPVLRTPDWSKPMIIQADASDIGIGAILTQNDSQAEYVIEYYSYKLTPTEVKYSPTEKEMMAVIKAIRHFRYYIEFNELTIYTDHHALRYLLNMKVVKGRLARWILELQPFVNNIQHRSGRDMVVADALSRSRPQAEIRMLVTSEDDWYDEFIEELKENADNYPQYYTSQKIIYRKIPWKRNELDDDYREVPRPEMIQRIIHHAHLDTLHGGNASTYYNIKKKYWWPQMKEDIKQELLNCVPCAAIKFPNYNTTPLMGKFRIPNETMQTLSIDIKGPLPAAGRHRYKFIITLIDIFSRYAWAKKIPTATTPRLIMFLKEMFSEMGAKPKYLLHDNGTQFTSNEFQKFLVDNDIQTLPTPAYHPQANSVERFNRSLTEAIRFATARDTSKQYRWATELDTIVSKLNTRMNHVTGYSPFEVMFGKSPDDNSGEPPDEEAHKRIKRTAYMRSRLRYLQNKKQFNKRAINREFEVGEIVMCRSHYLSNAEKNVAGKLYPPFQVGKIVSKVHSSAYEIMKPEGKMQIINTNLIKGISKEIQHNLTYLFDSTAK